MTVKKSFFGRALDAIIEARTRRAAFEVALYRQDHHEDIKQIIK